MILLALFAPAAHAADCAPLSDADWQAALDAIDDKLAKQDFDGASSLAGDTKSRMPCLARPITPSEFARFAHDFALIEFLNQEADEAEKWGLAATYAFHDYPWPVWASGPTKPLLDVLARANEPLLGGPTDKSLLVPKGGAVLINGKPLTAPRARSDLPGLVQVADKSGVVIDGWWQDGANFADTVLGPAGAPAPVPAWYHAEDPTAALAAAKAHYGVTDDATGPAPAANACEKPMMAADFSALVQKANDALDVDDSVTFGEVNRQLTSGLPCLRDQLPQDDWARFLVDLAIVEYAVGGGWQQPLTTALSTLPGVDRSSAPPEVKSYNPPSAPPVDTDPLPQDSTFYLDGRQIATVPVLQGLHVVQRAHAGTWETRLIDGGTFPADWAPPPQISNNTPPPPTPAAPLPLHGNVGLLAGFGSEGQSPDFAGTFLPDGGAGSGVVLGVASSGVIGKTIGGFWEIGAPLQLSGTPPFDAYAGAAVGAGPLSIEVGGGASGVALTYGEKDHTRVLPQPHLGVALEQPMGGLVLDAGAGFGWIPAGMHADARVGVGGAGAVGWFASGDFSLASATFEQTGVVPARSVSTSRWRAGLRVGIRFGS